jgi:hypothetical protein
MHVENSNNNPELTSAEELKALTERRKVVDNEIYLSDREESNFRVVAAGIPIPPELQEKALTDEVKGFLGRVFDFNEQEQPTELFSPESGAIVVGAIGKYEISMWEEVNRLGSLESELNSATDDAE